MKQHWILRSENIKKLWIYSLALLISLILIQFILPITGHFDVEGWLGFGAWYGFISCVFMILFAKLLGIFVKRVDDYYEKD